MELPEAVRDEIASLEKRIVQVRSLAPAHRAASEAVRAAGFVQEPGVTGDTGTPYVGVHSYGSWGFRQVGAFGKALHRYGFRLLTQDDMGSMKVVRYTGPITLFVSFGRNASCKYVKVGEKMEPVYKLKCEEKP